MLILEPHLIADTTDLRPLTEPDPMILRLWPDIDAPARTTAFEVHALIAGINRLMLSHVRYVGDDEMKALGRDDDTAA